MGIFNIFWNFKAKVQLAKAIKMADDAHRQDGERYYVMPTTSGKLIVTDRKNFRILKSKHYIPQKATVKNLVDECFYCTPYKDGTGVLPDFVNKIKMQQYWAWVKHVRSKDDKKR